MVLPTQRDLASKRDLAFCQHKQTLHFTNTNRPCIFFSLIKIPRIFFSLIKSTPSTGTLCSSCLDEKKPTEKMRIELCDCQESYEDLRTEAEKRKDIPLTPKLVDPQQWLWEEDKEEKEREREGESNDGSEMEGKSQEEETKEVEEVAASGATVSEPGSGGG